MGKMPMPPRGKMPMAALPPRLLQQSIPLAGRDMGSTAEPGVAAGSILRAAGDHESGCFRPVPKKDLTLSADLGYIMKWIAAIGFAANPDL